MKQHRIILLGPPASGKGTQGWLLAERWNVSVVSAGDILRAEIAASTPLGQEAVRYMDHGNLVPDRVAVAATEGWLATHSRSFVFDGFPRTVGQAEALHEVLRRRGLPLDAVLWLELSLETITHRVSRRVVCAACGRSFQVGTHVESQEQTCPACGGKLTVRLDDDPATLATRMEQYRMHTEPVRRFYEDEGLLRQIQADGAPEEVFVRIEKALINHPAEATI